MNSPTNRTRPRGSCAVVFHVDGGDDFGLDTVTPVACTLGVVVSTSGDGPTIRGVRHAGIPVTTVPTKSNKVADAEDLHSQFQLAKSVRPEIVVVLRRKMRQILHQYFALFAQGAGNEADSRAL